MKLLRMLLVIPLLCLLAGCGEPHADLSKTKTHRSGTITFDYPDNWKVSEDLNSPEMQYVFVETPGDALVILQSYPTGEADSLPAFSEAFSKGSAEEMPLGKLAGSTFSAMPEAYGYEWIAEEFRIDLLGESIPHRRIYGTKELGDRRVFLIFQVASDDYSRSEPGFDLIRKSLRKIEEAEPEK